MKFSNYMILEFPSKSTNEAFARSAVACFAAQLDPTLEELAEQVELTPAFIGHLEAPNITKALSLDTLFDIAAALDVPAYKFLVFEED